MQLQHTLANLPARQCAGMSCLKLQREPLLSKCSSLESVRKPVLARVVLLNKSWKVRQLNCLHLTEMNLDRNAKLQVYQVLR